MTPEPEREKFYKTANVALKVWLCVVLGFMALAACVLVVMVLMAGGCAVAVGNGFKQAVRDAEKAKPVRAPESPKRQKFD